MQVEDTFSLYVSMSALAERRTDVGDRMVFCIHDLGRRLRVRKQQSRYGKLDPDYAALANNHLQPRSVYNC